MLKRIVSIFAITLIITGAFFEGYTERCPVFGATWDNCSTLEQQTKAFIAYCKSRDLTIEGSGADAITSFTTKAYQSCLNALGLNVNALQAEIKYATDSNSGLKYLFTITGADAMNRVFSQFLQDHDLEVGDSYDDDLIYTDNYIIDDNGNKVNLWLINANTSQGSSYSNHGNTASSFFIRRGGFLHTGNELLNNLSVGSNIDITHYFGGTALTWNIKCGSWSFVDERSGETVTRKAVSSNDKYWSIAIQDYSNAGGITVCKSLDNYYYYSVLSTGIGWGRYGDSSYFNITGKRIANNKVTEKTDNIYITTNNTTINNNNYGDNTYTVITNEGDVYNYNNGDDDEPSPDPPVNPDPEEPEPELPNGNGWDDFQLPEMPNDWLIYGMEHKFPFDIPFNIMFALSLLNHDPVTPHFEGDINLKVCTWHYDIDLSPFDDIAAMVRRFEILAFIIGLAIMTHNLINWG